MVWPGYVSHVTLSACCTQQSCTVLRAAQGPHCLDPHGVSFGIWDCRFWVRDQHPGWGSGHHNRHTLLAEGRALCCLDHSLRAILSQPAQHWKTASTSWLQSALCSGSFTPGLVLRPNRESEILLSQSLVLLAFAAAGWLRCCRYLACAVCLPCSFAEACVWGS